MRVTTKIEGGLVSRLKRPQKSYAERKARLLLDWSRIMRQEFAENFAAEGRPEPWVPLRPRTIAQKSLLLARGAIRARTPRGTLVPKNRPQPGPESLKILIRSGDLRKSVVKRNSRGNITRVDPMAGTVESGTSIIYAGVHQYGFEQKHIPARPFLFISAEGEDRMRQKTVEWLVQSWFNDIDPEPEPDPE